MHVDDRGRGRIAQGTGGRVRALRPDAGAQGGARRPARDAHRRAGALQRPVPQHPIERRFDESLPLVRIDIEQLRRVVINLVDNAVEARRRLGTGAPANGGPTITVETRHDPAQGVARILVADNGPGISAADRDKLFMPLLHQAPRSGLGLAIVRRIIEHGGSIEVHDNQPKGTRFVIEPAVRPASERSERATVPERGKGAAVRPASERSERATVPERGKGAPRGTGGRGRSPGQE